IEQEKFRYIFLLFYLSFFISITILSFFVLPAISCNIAFPLPLSTSLSPLCTGLSGFVTCCPLIYTRPLLIVSTALLLGSLKTEDIILSSLSDDTDCLISSAFSSPVLRSFILIISIIIGVLPAFS